MGYVPEMTRREEDLLMIRLDGSQTEAMEVSKKIGAYVWSEFSFYYEGKRRFMHPRISIGLVHPNPGENWEKLMGRFDLLVRTLRG